MTGGKAEKCVFLGGVCDVHPVSDKVTKYITRLLLEIMCTVFVIEGGYSQDQPSVRGIKRKKMPQQLFASYIFKFPPKKKNFFCTSLFG